MRAKNDFVSLKPNQLHYLPLKTVAQIPDGGLGRLRYTGCIFVAINSRSLCRNPIAFVMHIAHLFWLAAWAARIAIAAPSPQALVFFAEAGRPVRLIFLQGLGPHFVQRE